MTRPVCSPNENIVRAIHSNHWDEKKNRWGSDLFKGIGTSVSRLSILDMAALFVIFHQELDKPLEEVVYKAGEIEIAYMQHLAESYKNSPTHLTVEEDPTPKNPAHAEIPQNITRGLAFVIIEKLKLHDSPFVQNAT